MSFIQPAPLKGDDFDPTVSDASPLDCADSQAKRALDIAIALVGLVVLAPLMLLVGLAIYGASPGKVTFRQTRVGRRGKTFEIVKFRSMVADAEGVLTRDAALQQLYLEHDHKIPAHLDGRITKFGRVMRATSLDELPQLWNVLVGDMSLVGPRPVVPAELALYGKLAPVYQSVRPGLTGPWQASGRSTIAYPERAEIDAHYVLNWSMRADLEILVKTIPAVLKCRGAN